MPHFYFDVREGARFSPDNMGLDFDSLDTAEQEAARVAAGISRDQLPKGNVREVTVEVKNEHGQRVLTVTTAMIVYLLTIPIRAIGQCPRCRSLLLACIPEPVRNRPLAFRGELRTEALINQGSQFWRGQVQDSRITPAAAGSILADEEAPEARALILNLEP
jgi:hypothetical protein